MTDAPQRFRVIDGGSQPKPSRKRSRKEAELITCWKCEQTHGISGNLTIEVRLGRMIRDGRPEGGTKAIACARCFTVLV